MLRNLGGTRDNKMKLKNIKGFGNAEYKAEY
jgi:hypothetical protein